MISIFVLFEHEILHNSRSEKIFNGHKVIPNKNQKYTYTRAQDKYVFSTAEKFLLIPQKCSPFFLFLLTALTSRRRWFQWHGTPTERPNCNFEKKKTERELWRLMADESTVHCSRMSENKFTSINYNDFESKLMHGIAWTWVEYCIEMGYRLCDTHSITLHALHTMGLSLKYRNSRMTEGKMIWWNTRHISGNECWQSQWRTFIWDFVWSLFELKICSFLHQQMDYFIECSKDITIHFDIIYYL